MLKENVLRSNMDPDSLKDKILILGLKYATHRVGRVLSVSPVVGIGTPPPL